MAASIWSSSVGLRTVRGWVTAKTASFGRSDSGVWYGRFYHNAIRGSGGAIDEKRRLRIRRDAGEWVRTQMRYSAAAVLTLLSGIFGLLAGVVLSGLIGWQSLVLPTLCLTAAAVFLARRFEQGGFARLLKGVAAERSIGGLAEYALTAQGCAVAHSVTKISEIGDIDHLFATPGCLWVVETKYGMVPKEHFSEVLRRLRVNLQSVGRWAPSGVEVNGCLVFATISELPQKRLYENGQIEVFDPETLVCKLRRAAAEPSSGADVSLARRVWALAGGRLA